MTKLIEQKTKNYILIAMVFFCAFFYIYVANMTVRTVTLLEKTKKDVQLLSLKVSEMESKRLSAENDLTTNKAISLGFVEASHPTFIMKSSSKVTLSFKVE